MSTSASPMPQATKADKPFLMVPHEFLEEVMPVLSGDAFKIALVAYREIVGRHRTETCLSYTQLQKKTGIKRRPDLAKALKEALAAGVLILCEAITGMRRTKFYTLAKRWMTGSPVELVSTDHSLHLVPTSSPVELVNDGLVHQKNQNRFTSGTSTGSPVELVEAQEAAPPQAPEAAPYKAYKENVERNVEDNVVAFDASSVAPNGAAVAVKKEDELTLREKEDEVALIPVGNVSDSLQQEREVAPELESLWNLVRATLRANNTEACYENWLAPLRVAGCEGTILYLQSKTTYHAEHFQQRFATQASGELSKIIHRAAEVCCLPPPSQPRQDLPSEPEIVIESTPEPPPSSEPQEEKPLTLKALVARDLFHFPPTGWNKGAAKAVQNVVNQLEEVHVTAETAPTIIQRFKRERPTGSVYEFLTKLPALVAAAAGAY